MPRPLPAPDTLEGRFHTDMAAAPCDPVRRLMVGDAQKDGDRPLLGDMRCGIETLRSRFAARSVHLTSLDQLELMRGSTFIEEECYRVAASVYRLLETPDDFLREADARALERSLSVALGPPRRAAEGLDPLRPENLRSQYAFQTALLASLGLLEAGGDGAVGIAGIDVDEAGRPRFHPLSPLDAIATRLQTPALRRKVAQGFDRLLLVPFGLPLKRLLDAWRQGLRRNEHLLRPHGGLDPQTPLWLWEQYEREDPVYFPERFAPDHGGRTKPDLLAGPAQAWHVLLVESALTDLPRQGQGRAVGGRPQLEAGSSPQAYLTAQPADEAGWTPESYVVAFLTELEARGQVLDPETLSYLTAAYLPASSYVPYACWDPCNQRASLDGLHPDWAYPSYGARAAVRVV